jgi:hypothetical protein
MFETTNVMNIAILGCLASPTCIIPSAANVWTYFRVGFILYCRNDGEIL